MYKFESKNQNIDRRFSMAEKEKNKHIECDVEDCKHNNCDCHHCKLDEIKVCRGKRGNNV